MKCGKVINERRACEKVVSLHLSLASSSKGFHLLRTPIPECCSNTCTTLFLCLEAFEAQLIWLWVPISIISQTLQVRRAEIYARSSRRLFFQFWYIEDPNFHVGMKYTKKQTYHRPHGIANFPPSSRVTSGLKPHHTRNGQEISFDVHTTTEEKDCTYTQYRHRKWARTLLA